MKPEEAKFHVTNRTIGRNLATLRKLRAKKAWEVVEYLRLKDASYTKYERGENKITIELIQKAAECLSVDPIKSIADPLKSTHIIPSDLIIKISETLTEVNKALRQILGYQINPGSSMDKA